MSINEIRRFCVFLFISLLFIIVNSASAQDEWGDDWGTVAPPAPTPAPAPVSVTPVAPAPAPAATAELPRIAVYVTGDVPDNEKTALGTRMLASLVNSGRYRGIERSGAFLAEIEREQIHQRSGAIDDAQISALGRQFGVRYVCIAAITPALGAFQVSARIVNVETAEVMFIGEGSTTLATLDDLQRVSDEVVIKMFGEHALPRVPAAPQVDAQTQPQIIHVLQVREQRERRERQPREQRIVSRPFSLGIRAGGNPFSRPSLIVYPENRRGDDSHRDYGYYGYGRGFGANLGLAANIPITERRWSVNTGVHVLYRNMRVEDHGYHHRYHDGWGYAYPRVNISEFAIAFPAAIRVSTNSRWVAVFAQTGFEVDIPLSVVPDRAIIDVGYKGGVGFYLGKHFEFGVNVTHGLFDYVNVPAQSGGFLDNKLFQVSLGLTYMLKGRVN